MKYIVFEWPYRDCEFPSLDEAIYYVMAHKSGVRDCCWIENQLGEVVWRPLK